MAHLHEDSDTYYLDQLCLVALSAAFGGVCLSLYFWQTSMLALLLGPQFHGFVLASGVVLLGLAVIRAVILWLSSGKVSRAHHHEHDHHGHDHEHCHHDHDHGHEHNECSGHDHNHEHAHDHVHGHNHSHAHGDHDHDWAPWRYVLMLAPIILFLLGLPNKPPQAGATAVKVEMSGEEASAYITLVAMAVEPWSELALGWAVTSESKGSVEPIGFKEVEQLALKDEDRAEYKGKRVSVIGQFSPHPQNDHVFSLVRFRIRCCAADAIPLNVPMICKESLAGFKPNEWVQVTGTVDFYKRGDNNTYTTLLRVNSREAIKPTAPDTNPWIQ
jgi:uncharacterized repeat protein (TIGR03943 family)